MAEKARRASDRRTGRRGRSRAGSAELETASLRCPDSEELRGADRPGPRARLPDLRGDRGDARGGRGHQGAGPGPARLPDRARRRRDRRGRAHRLQGGEGRGGQPGPVEEARARPHGRAEPRLAAPLPALDRAGRAAHRRPGDRAREADREGRHGRQAPHGRGEPAARRLDREGLSRPRAQLPRPDPGGLAGADPGGGEVRLPPRLQVLDLRDLVDPPGGDAGDRRQGADDPDPGPHGREAEPGHPRRAPAGAAAGPRAGAARRSPRS